MWRVVHHGVTFKQIHMWLCLWVLLCVSVCVNQAVCVPLFWPKLWILSDWVTTSWPSHPSVPQPLCNCNCISAVLIFLLDTLSQSPQAHFPLLDWVEKDNTVPHSAVHWDPPGETSLHVSRQNWDIWGYLGRTSGSSMSVCVMFALTIHPSRL